jgi:hypothetical protein
MATQPQTNPFEGREGVHVPLGAEYPTPDMPLITVPQILSPDFAREMAPRLPVIKEGQFAAQPGKQLYISFTLGRAAFYQTYRVEEIARLACRYKTLLWIGQTMNIHRYWGGQLRTVYERVNTGRIEPVSPETWANVFQDIVRSQESLPSSDGKKMLLTQAGLLYLRNDFARKRRR